MTYLLQALSQPKFERFARIPRFHDLILTRLDVSLPPSIADNYLEWLQCKASTIR